MTRFSENSEIISYLREIESEARLGNIQHQCKVALERVSLLNIKLREQSDELARLRLLENNYKIAARHWEEFQAAIKSHPSLQNSWDNFLMMMKLTQAGDKNG